jgi:chromosome segregation ATPase
MTQSARVSSIDALKALHATLSRFGPEAREALGAAEMEIRRVFDYLEDQLKYWLRQVDRRHEDLNRARSDLAHARAIRQGERSGYVEQEIAVRKAQVRLREAEEKVVTVRRWLVHLPQAVNEYQGPSRRLAGLLDADLRQGLAILEQRIAALDAYVALEAPPEPASPAAQEAFSSTPPSGAKP